MIDNLQFKENEVGSWICYCEESNIEYEIQKTSSHFVLRMDGEVVFLSLLENGIDNCVQFAIGVSNAYIESLSDLPTKTPRCYNESSLFKSRDFIRNKRPYFREAPKVILEVCPSFYKISPVTIDDNGYVKLGAKEELDKIDAHDFYQKVDRELVYSGAYLKESKNLNQLRQLI